ncbi:MAG: GNAT family N-acetyltransferase, partial [Methanoregula sp.]
MDSFFIRSEIPEDIPAIYEVNLQAFGQDGEARLVSALRHDGDYIRGLSLVAVHKDKIIGHILFVPVSIESGDIHVPA